MESSSNFKTLYIGDRLLGYTIGIIESRNFETHSTVIHYQSGSDRIFHW